MKKKPVKKRLNVEVSIDLHDMLKKLCVDTGLTATEIIVQYLEYLQKKHYKQRQVLDESSTTEFKLDERKPG